MKFDLAIPKRQFVDKIFPVLKDKWIKQKFIQQCT